MGVADQVRDSGGLRHPLGKGATTARASPQLHVGPWPGCERSAHVSMKSRNGTGWEVSLLEDGGKQPKIF